MPDILQIFKKISIVLICYDHVLESTRDHGSGPGAVPKHLHEELRGAI